MPAATKKATAKKAAPKSASAGRSAEKSKKSSASQSKAARSEARSNVTPIKKGESEFTPKLMRIDELKPHPRNYRLHPPDQLDHIEQSIKEHGFYRNVVCANEGTLLAGHGVVETLKRMGRPTVPVIQLDIDPDSAAALKVLAGDNAIGHLGEVDDRMFTEILKEIKESDDEFGLLGTGYDDMMLANLLFVSRPEHEVKDIDEAAEWVGMPDYDPSSAPVKLVISFKNAEDRESFAQDHEIEIDRKTDATWMTWWPFKERDDVSSVRFKAS